MDEKKVLKELNKTILKEPNNYDKILELSLRLVSFDKENVRFSVDAGVIDRLGVELVARHETAVSELVKNAYDADATIVDLVFENTNNKGGTLTIEDNGDGMTRDQLINGFMRISSAEKIHNPISPGFGRKRAGRKGIGRFATQRLGNKLTITTQTKNSNKALTVTINWDKFEPNKDLLTISNSIKEIPKLKTQGTTLEIYNLREWWPDASIKRVYRYLTEILQPFPLSKKHERAQLDPGFKANLFKKSGNDGRINIADDQKMFYEHALAEIEAYVKPSGKAYWSIKSKKLRIGKKESELGKPNRKSSTNYPYKYLNNIHLKAYYFIVGQGLLPKMMEGYIREVTTEIGGIRVYRNGFRVLPYAEENNDWVGLDESTRRKTIVASHGNLNFLGFVEINDKKEAFTELSSREGFLKDEAYEELVDFVYRSLIAAVLRIAAARGRKGTAGQKDWVKKERPSAESVKEIAEEISEIANEFEKDAGEKGKGKGRREGKNKSDRLREMAESLKEAADYIDELGMLRVLAGLGLTIGEFIHEIKQYLPAFDVDTQFLLDNLKAGTEKYKRSLRLQKTFNSFNSYTSYFDNAIAQNIQRELIPIELRDVVNTFHKVITPDLERNNFKLEKKFVGYDLFTGKMHPSEWASILFNLYSNSKKAIKRSKENEIGRILISCGFEKKIVYLDFADNGDGIPSENEGKIFRAFFTTSSPSSKNDKDVHEFTGMGLGLKIIKDIANGYGGDIYLTPPPKGFKTCFRIELPRANEEEIKDYAI